MADVQELRTTVREERRSDESTRVQSSVYLLELSVDWIVLRASENIHHLLGESHVTLIDEPLGRFVKGQPLHDLRNLFSRLSGTTGIGRAYCVRLTDEHEFVDIAFQLVGGRVLLEAVPSSGIFGECFGTVGGLIAGLAGATRQALLDAGARRMRALTGYDHVQLACGDDIALSSRTAQPRLDASSDDLPVVIADVEDEGVGIFPREVDDTSVDSALMCAADSDCLDALRKAGIRSLLRVPFAGGEFLCCSRTARACSFEVHAAAELFAQLFAMQLEIDRLRRRD